MTMDRRNQKIKKLYNNGLSLSQIGLVYKITRQRVFQIIKKPEKQYTPNGVSYAVDPSKHKILTRAKREYLGLPTDKVREYESGGRGFLHELVRMRDKHTCQSCGKKWQKGQRRFDVHHNDEHMDGKSRSKGILQWDRNNFDKLVTLCHKCHLNLDVTRQKMRKGCRSVIHKGGV